MADVELMIVKPLQLADSSIQYSLFILLTQLFEKIQHLFSQFCSSVLNSHNFCKKDGKEQVVTVTAGTFYTKTICKLLRLVPVTPRKFTSTICYFS